MDASVPFPAGASGSPISLTTVFSLLAVAAIGISTHALTDALLPPSSSRRTRALFAWHLFSALMHFTLEASYLHSTLFVSSPVHALPPGPAEYISPPEPTPGGFFAGLFAKPTPEQQRQKVLLDQAAMAAAEYSLFVGRLRRARFTPPGTHFLSDARNAYGAAHGGPANPFAALWREYARADARWAGGDPVIVAIELATVLVVAPLGALGVVAGIYAAEWQREGPLAGRPRIGRSGMWEGARGQRRYFWMAVVAVAELYGGWMTFVPEWLVGSAHLDTASWMYKWLYLAFFNLVWVFAPLWVLCECWIAWGDMLPREEVIRVIQYLGDAKSE